MKSFKQWLNQQESSPATRARRAAAQGLLPMATIGSPHGHSTAHPWEIEQIKKSEKKKKKSKKKSIKESKKVVKNTEVDKWLGSVADLKNSLDTLKGALSKRKSDKELPDNEKEDEKEQEQQPAVPVGKRLSKKPADEETDDKSEPQDSKEDQEQK